MKGIIVVDVPKSCMECDYRKTGAICIKTEKDIFHYGMKREKPDWCPIKSLPEKMKLTGDVSNVEEISKESIRIGWNKCIDEILKGENIEEKKE